MAAREIRAGKAYVELGTKDAGFLAGLKNAEEALKKVGAAVRNIGAGIAGVGAAGLAPIIAAVTSFSAAGSSIADMAARTGASAEFLSSLGFAAGQAGSSLEELEHSFRKMQKLAGDALSGNAGAIQSLADLGIRAERLAGMNPEQIFAAIAKEVAAIENPTQRAAAAMEAFGKSGTKILPLIADMDALTTRARELGVVMSAGDAQAADALGDAFDELAASIGGLRNAIGASLASTITEIVARMADAVAIVTNFIRQNQQLVVIATAVAGGLAIVGSVVFAAGVAFSAIGVALGGIAAASAAIGAALAAILSPLGLVLATYATVATSIGLHTGAINQAIKWLKDRFGELAKWVKDVFGSILNALRAGDFKAAADVAWNAIVLSFETAMQPLRETWAGVKMFFLETWNGVVFGIQAAWTEVESFLKNSFERIRGWFVDTWLQNNKQIAETMKVLGQVTGNPAMTYAAEQLAKVGNINTSDQIKKIVAAKVGVIQANRENMLAAIQADEMNERERILDDAAKAVSSAKKRVDDARANLTSAQSTANALTPAQVQQQATQGVAAAIAVMGGSTGSFGRFGGADIGRLLALGTGKDDPIKQVVRNGETQIKVMREIKRTIEQTGMVYG